MREQLYNVEAINDESEEKKLVKLTMRYESVSKERKYSYDTVELNRFETKCLIKELKHILKETKNK